GETFSGAIIDAQQRRVALRIPAVHDAIADGHAGRPRDAEPHHLLARDDVRLDVDGVELDPPRRQELLRLGAGRSAGAGVQACLHRVSLYPTRNDDAAPALSPLRLGVRSRGARRERRPRAKAGVAVAAPRRAAT